MIIAFVRAMIRVSGKQLRARAALKAIEAEGRDASPGTIPAGSVIRLISGVDGDSQPVEAAWRGHRLVLIADDLVTIYPPQRLETPNELPRPIQKRKRRTNE
jgi:hypothetical protein